MITFHGDGKTITWERESVLAGADMEDKDKKDKLRKLAEVGVRNCTQTIPSQDVLDLLSECSRLASRVLELEADVTRWQLLAGKLDCKTCTPGLASRVEELAKKWKAAAMADVPPSYADRELHHKYLKLDNYASGQDDCADELLALLAGAHAEEKE